MFKKGNKIKIKKANRGKFTEYCGGNVTSECIRRGKNSSDPKIRKRATFAANARKWKHLNGGIIDLINDSQLGIVVKTLDPTGITSYYDVYNAGRDLYNNPNVGNVASLGLELFGAIPLIGKVGKGVKTITKLGSKLYSKKAAEKYGLDMGDEITRDFIDLLILRAPGVIKDSYDSLKSESKIKYKAQ